MAASTRNEDQMKRTQDALNRRFKQAEAELHPHQQKDKTSDLQQHQNNKPPSKLTLPDASTNQPTKDPDLQTPAYFQLLHQVNENLATADEITNPMSTVDFIMHDYLQHGDVAPKYSKASRRMDSDKHILLDNFVSKGDKSEETKSRALKRHAKRSRKHASLKQHKMLGSFDFPAEYHNFERFRPLHEMWKSYISQLLKNIGKDQLLVRLLDADLQGAIILVAHCKETSLSGVNGIVIRETAETFGIITQDDKFRVVPKKQSVFMLQAESWKVTLYGDKLRS